MEPLLQYLPDFLMEGVLTRPSPAKEAPEVHMTAIAASLAPYSASLAPSHASLAPSSASLPPSSSLVRLTSNHDSWTLGSQLATRFVLIIVQPPLEYLLQASFTPPYIVDISLTSSPRLTGGDCGLVLLFNGEEVT